MSFATKASQGHPSIMQTNKIAICYHGDECANNECTFAHLPCRNGEACTKVCTIKGAEKPCKFIHPGSKKDVAMKALKEAKPEEAAQASKPADKPAFKPKEKCMKVYGCCGNADYMNVAVTFGKNPKVSTAALRAIIGGLEDAIRAREKKN